MNRYFVLGALPGSPHTRYAVLLPHGRAEVQISRPEGELVERPERVRYVRGPFVGGPLARPQFNTGAGERTEVVSTLMPGSATDEGLARARARGSFRRAA